MFRLKVAPVVGARPRAHATRHILTAFLAGAALPGGLGLASAVPASAAPTTVTLTWFTNPENSPVVADLAKAFEASHPAIKLKVVTGPSDTDTARTVLSTEISGGSSTPDVYSADVTWPVQFAHSGLAADLSQYLPASFFKQFAPGLITDAAYQGSYYTVPWIMDAGFLYYRTDLLAKDHLPVPKTWSQLVSESKELQSQHLVKYGYVWQGAPYEGLTCDWMEVMADAGASVVNSSYSKSTIDSSGSLKALNFLRSVITSGVSPKAVTTFEEPQALTLFTDGDAAFMRQWSYAWAIAQTPSSSSVVGKVSLAPLPTFSGPGPGYSTVGGADLAINPHSRYMSQDVSFVKWLVGLQAQTILAKVGKLLPVTTAAQHSPAVRNIDAPLEVLPELKLVSRPEGTSDYAALSEGIYRNINPALSGNTSAQAALSAASSQINTALSSGL